MAGDRKGRYTVTNWAKYNEALVARGSITLWFSDDVIANWRHANDTPRRGHPFVFSDAAIECLLMVREVFRLPYRQTEGFAKSLLELMQLSLPVPDFTSLAKRAAKLNVAVRVRERRGSLDIVVDSTGLKVYGEGEWKVRQHGVGKRRTWRKLHLAVDPTTHEIVATTLTENSCHDADQAEPLAKQIRGEIGRFYGDGAYDKWKVYDMLCTRRATPIIPPQHNAKIKQHGNSNSSPLPRDTAIRRIRQVGRSEWKREADYHQRSLAETAMFRLKTVFGGGLKNRLIEMQRVESQLRCKILNKFTKLGMPAFEWN